MGTIATEWMDILEKLESIPSLTDTVSNKATRIGGMLRTVRTFAGDKPCRDYLDAVLKTNEMLEELSRVNDRLDSILLLLCEVTLILKERKYYYPRIK
jgi:hypothetical protein